MAWYAGPEPLVLAELPTWPSFSVMPCPPPLTPPSEGGEKSAQKIGVNSEPVQNRRFNTPGSGGVNRGSVMSGISGNLETTAGPMPRLFDPMGLPEAVADLVALAALVKQEAIRLQREPVVVEIGTWAGRSAIMMAEHARSVHCIDHWMGNPHDCLGPIAEKIGKQKAFITFCTNCGDLLFDKIFPYYGESAGLGRCMAV